MLLRRGSATLSEQLRAPVVWQAGGGALPARYRRLPLAEAAVVGLAAVVAWLVENRAAALPAWAPWDFSWTEFLAAGWVLVWFGRGMCRTTATARMAAWRCGCFVLGLASIYVVLLTRFEFLTQHMFFLNRVQHAVLHHMGPFLIALSWPGATIARGMPLPVRRLCGSAPVRCVLRGFQNPWLAAFLFEGLLFFWLIPPITFRAMLDARLYDIMNASMLLDGLLFWCLALDPRPKPAARVGFIARAAIAFLVIFPQMLLGTAISLANRDLYPAFSLCGRVYPAIGPLLDQQIGALILWVPTGMMSSIAVVVIMWRFFHHEDRIALGYLSGQAPAAHDPDDR